VAQLSTIALVPERQRSGSRLVEFATAVKRHRVGEGPSPKRSLRPPTALPTPTCVIGPNSRPRCGGVFSSVVASVRSPERRFAGCGRRNSTSSADARRKSLDSRPYEFVTARPTNDPASCADPNVDRHTRRDEQPSSRIRGVGDIIYNDSDDQTIKYSRWSSTRSGSRPDDRRHAGREESLAPPGLRGFAQSARSLDAILRTSYKCTTW
jgi:hypothetical protein